MLKNLIIFTQTVMLICVACWVYIYHHRIEQIFISDKVSNYAIEARFKIAVADVIAAGKAQDAERMLRNVGASNVQSAVDSVETLDLRMEDLAADAEGVAQILDEIGVSDLSEALRERKQKFQE